MKNDDHSDLFGGIGDTLVVKQLLSTAIRILELHAQFTGWVISKILVVVLISDICLLHAAGFGGNEVNLSADVEVD